MKRKTDLESVKSMELSYSSATANLGPKYTCYCTIIFVPSTDPVIEIGVATWPCMFDKAIKCPRVLLLNSWADRSINFY